MKTLVCLLEEPSAKEMLQAVLPKILPDIHVKYLVHEGKQDLEKQLERRLRAWQVPDSVFLILRDQDSGNCISIKNDLAEKVANSGKTEKTLIRIACHELESFYLGDLNAVEQAMHIRGLSSRQNNQKFQNPDRLNNASEELRKVTGYRYQKIAGSRAIAPFLSVLAGENRSRSFNVLLQGLQNLAQS